MFEHFQIQKIGTSHTVSVITRIEETNIIENKVQDIIVNENVCESNPAKRYHVEKLRLFGHPAVLPTLDTSRDAQNIPPVLMSFVVHIS